MSRRVEKTRRRRRRRVIGRDSTQWSVFRRFLDDPFGQSPRLDAGDLECDGPDSMNGLRALRQKPQLNGSIVAANELKRHAADSSLGQRVDLHGGALQRQRGELPGGRIAVELSGHNARSDARDLQTLVCGRLVGGTPNAIRSRVIALRLICDMNGGVTSSRCAISLDT